MKIRNLYLLITAALLPFTTLLGQDPNLAVEQTKISRIWGGIAANGDKATFDFRAGFFPNDFDLIQYRGQGSENYFGSGFRLACTGWTAPDDSFYRAAVFGPVNDYMLYGTVTEPITNYIRFRYPDFTTNGLTTGLNDFGFYDPTRFADGTYDQVVQSTYENVLGVEVKRRLLFWSQEFNDNYYIIEVELTNNGYLGDPDTLKNFFLSMSMGVANNYYSNGMFPSLPSSERPKYSYVWQHYYGARDGDSLRIFYFYSADDPESAGDDMGSPVPSQKNRLLNTNMIFYTILHVSESPFTNPADDVDDFLQPKVTYIGTETKIPNPDPGEDPYGSKSYWSISGGYSDKYPRPNTFSGTHHGINNDELMTSDFSNFPAGTIQSINSKNFCSFGPYTFLPNHKIRIVYAVGVTGLGMEKSKEIGKKWAEGNLTDPPNMPDPVTGWFPSGFVFPTGATEQDKIKDRWISTGIDSVMFIAWRAKWNFDHNYQIPLAPPPPESFHIRGSGEKDGVVLTWNGSSAEAMSNFAGYRIMRRLTNQDTVSYVPIYESGSEDKAVEHELLDSAVLSGAPYYYYIQSKALIDENDFNADPTTRGKIMYSSRVWIPNINSVKPPKLSTEDMSKIRIVPNPYNINDPLVRSLFVQYDNRGLNFYNLPRQVTIRIYTENGDLVKTIEHYNPVDNDGSEFWDMLTDNQQVINSGIYVALFQKPSGETSFQKFIVVR